MKITCIVHTLDSAATLEAALSSARWVDELLVFDMGSSDATVAIAGRWADRVVQIERAARVDGVRSRCLEEAGGDWILVLDSDESLAADAGAALRALIAEHGGTYDAFAIPRFNEIAGQIMRGPLWYPDHQIRLFRTGTVRWLDRHHAQPEVATGPHRLLELEPPACPHIHHRNYPDVRAFIRKQVEYALSDSYDPDPAAFDFSLYLAQAHRDLALRRDVACDGDLSHALALLMAWNAVIRGLVHWDVLDRRPPLAPGVALPEAGPGAIAPWEVALRRFLFGRHALRFLAHRLRDRLRGAAQAVTSRLRP
jgi:glycosyltransferase involved in cell wall biosynthesis